MRLWTQSFVKGRLMASQHFFFFEKVQNLKKYSVGWGWGSHICSSSLDHPCRLPGGVATILSWFCLHGTCGPAWGALGPKSESRVSFQLTNYWADLPDHSHQRYLPGPFILAKWKDCRERRKGRHRVSTIADFQIQLGFQVIWLCVCLLTPLFKCIHFDSVSLFLTLWYSSWTKILYISNSTK